MHLARLGVLTQSLSLARCRHCALSCAHAQTHTCTETTHLDNFSFVFFPCILLPVFISQAALYSGVKELYGLNKRVEAVSNVRKLSKLDMKLNDALPSITVDPETYTVIADGEVLTCPAASTVPLSRNYFLF